MTDRIKNPHLPTGCCVPFIRAWPSGFSWTHSGRCDFSKNQKFTTDEIHALNSHTLDHQKEPSLEYIAVVHPACKVAAAEGTQPCSRCAPILHADDDCECDACVFYLGNLDRDDDAEVSHG